MKTLIVAFAFAILTLVPSGASAQVWQDNPYNPASFSAFPVAGNFWVVPPTSIGPTNNRYVLNGNTMTWTLSIGPSNVYQFGQPVTALRVAIPDNRVATSIATCAYQAIEGAGHVGIAYTLVGSPNLYLFHADTTLPWASTVNGINFTCTFEVK